MARSAQLQGCVFSWRPLRSPNPRHITHEGEASAKVSDLVHSMFSSFPSGGVRTGSKLRGVRLHVFSIVLGGKNTSTKINLVFGPSVREPSRPEPDVLKENHFSCDRIA